MFIAFLCISGVCLWGQEKQLFHKWVDDLRTRRSGKFHRIHRLLEWLRRCVKLSVFSKPYKTQKTPASFSCELLRPDKLRLIQLMPFIEVIPVEAV